MPRLRNPTSASARALPDPEPPVLTPQGYAWPEHIARYLAEDRRLAAREIMKALLLEEGLPALYRLMRDPDLPPAIRLRTIEFLTERVVAPLSATTHDAEKPVDELPVPQVVIEGQPPDLPEV